MTFYGGWWDESEIVTLTRRQKEVLQLAAHGLTYRGIARRLDISPYTVKGIVSGRPHDGGLLRVLGAGCLAEAVAIGLRMGIIE